MQKVLSVFKGEVIKPKMVTMDVNGRKRDDVEECDILGCTVFFHRESGWMKWTMRDAIDRFLKANHFELTTSGRRTTIPCTVGADLESGTPDEKYPLRRVVGGALYIALQGRPDVSFAVAKLSRYVARCTSACVS